MLTKISKKLLLSIVYCLLSIVLIGCATVRKGPPRPPKGIAGIYHRVQKDQTLWRISKAYGIDLERIANINRLADTSRIYVGQLIFIPEANGIIENLTLETDFKDTGGDFIWPTKGRVISFFGMTKDGVKNKGIYIQAKATAVSAARSGKVAFCSDQLKGYGKIVILDHLDGYSTVYAHTTQNLVKLNYLVKQGQVIAKVGSKPGAASPEFYFEIRKGHKPQNPFFYLP